MSEELSIKMDHDPAVPASIEDEIRNARRNLSDRQMDEQSFAYWKGVLDGLETAFKMTKRKEGE